MVRLLEVPHHFLTDKRLIAITGPIFWLWSVLAVELTLVWNHVEGVYTVKSTGQIIPFVAGLGILVRMFWILRDEHKVGCLGLSQAVHC